MSLLTANILEAAAAVADLTAFLVAALIAVISFSGPTRLIIRLRIWWAKRAIRTWIKEHGRRGAAQDDPVGSAKVGPSRAIWRQTSEWVSGEELSPAKELDWLARVAGPDAIVGYGDEALSQLADAYLEFAGRVDLRFLIAGGGQPVLEQAAKVSRRVAEMLRDRANLIPVADPDSDASAKVRLIVTPGKTVWPGETDPSGATSTYQTHQLVTHGKPAHYGLKVRWDMRPEAPDSTRVADSSEGPAPSEEAQVREYNGLLPILRNHRFGQDQAWGEFYLDLDLGSRFYNDYVKTKHLEATEEHPGILTLALLPITTCGHFIVAPRGPATRYYPGCWGCGANGNLDVPREKMASPDLDPDGMIDPLRAVLREAREEIGLEIPPRRVRSLGFAQLENPTERGTWVLLSLALTDLTVEEVAHKSAEADPITGAWELGGDLAAIPIPGEDDALRLLSWVRESEKMSPHLAAAVEFLVSTSLKRPLGDLPKGRSEWRPDPDEGQLADLGLPIGAKLLNVGALHHG